MSPLASSGVSKSGDARNRSAPVAASMPKNDLSSPPASANVKLSCSGSVAVNRPTAVVFSATSNWAGEVKTGASSLPAISMVAVCVPTPP